VLKDSHVEKVVRISRQKRPCSAKAHQGMVVFAIPYVTSVLRPVGAAVGGQGIIDVGEQRFGFGVNLGEGMERQPTAKTIQP